MANDPNSPSGGTPSGSGGAPENDPDKNQPDHVSYDTHRKLLGEKKKRDEENGELRKRLEEFERKESERQEAELKAKDDLKKLLELKEKKIADLEKQYGGLKGNLELGFKRQALLDAVNGEVEQQYWGLLPVDKVVLDPNTGLPDQSSVAEAVKEFETQYGLVIRKPTGNGLPPDAPRGSGAKLTIEAWNKLPLKERKERMHEVDFSAATKK